eukprot:scaffold22292_cov121-Isochrysis_galbana.AAC.2
MDFVHYFSPFDGVGGKGRPRLPSALGLGGAKRKGGLDRRLDPPMPMRSDSPNSPNPLSPIPSPQAQPSPCQPLHSSQLPTRREEGKTSCTTHYLSPYHRVGGKGRVNPNFLLGLEVLPPSLNFCRIIRGFLHFH